MKMSTFFVYVLSAVLMVTGMTFIVVSLEWRKAPRYQVDGAHLNTFEFSYVPGQPGNGLLVRQLNLTIQVSLSNLQTPSSVQFRELKIAIAIANQTAGLILAPGPFHVHGREVLALGAFNVIAANISLEEPDIIRSIATQQVLPLQLSGHAYTSRKEAFFIRRHQTPEMECVINFNFPGGEALLPFKCKSHTPTEI